MSGSTRKIRFEGLDDTLVMAAFVALCCGLVMVTSATVPLTEDALHFTVRHALMCAGGVAAFALFLLCPLRLWDVVHRGALLLALFVCGLVLLVGREINGSQRWIPLGFFTLQAGELAKLLLLIYLAGYLARVRERIGEDLVLLLRPLAWCALLLGLILVQPDFGTVGVLSVMIGGLLFLAGARLRHFFVVACVAAIALASLAVLQPYRVQRLITFTDPWAFAYSSGYQLTQALIAFGRGEYTGLGLGDGVQKLSYLPEAHNDFIFAVIAEELGLIGAVLVLLLLLFIVLRVMKIAREAISQERHFAGFIAYGVALLLGVQLLIHIGVNTGRLPTKGLTLPFVSFGGNSLLVCCALLGLAARAQWEGKREQS